MFRLTAVPLGIAVALALSVPALAGPVLTSGSATVSVTESHGGPHGGFVFKSTMSPPPARPILKKQLTWQQVPSQRIVRCGGRVYTEAQGMRNANVDMLRCLAPKPPFAPF